MDLPLPCTTLRHVGGDVRGGQMSTSRVVPQESSILVLETSLGLFWEPETHRLGEADWPASLKESASCLHLPRARIKFVPVHQIFQLGVED